jgi:hypothetical protein
MNDTFISKKKKKKKKNVKFKRPTLNMDGRMRVGTHNDFTISSTSLYKVR